MMYKSSGEGLKLKGDLQKIKGEYDKGEFDNIRDLLLEWVEANAGKLIEFWSGVGKALKKCGAIDFLTAIKFRIIEVKSINTAFENELQLWKMKKEIWREEGLDNSNIPDHMAYKWFLEHAPHWRENYVMALIIILEENRIPIENIIKDYAEKHEIDISCENFK